MFCKILQNRTGASNNDGSDYRPGEVLPVIALPVQKYANRKIVLVPGPAYQVWDEHGYDDVQYLFVEDVKLLPDDNSSLPDLVFPLSFSVSVIGVGSL